MNLLGTHGTEAVAWIFFIASLPFTALLWFKDRLDIDTYTMAVTLGGLLYCVACIFFAIGDVQHREWTSIPVWVFLFVINLWFLYRTWKRRKDKRKADAAIGAKSRARRDKLVRALRGAQPEGSR